jgi:hypothetical protein
MMLTRTVSYRFAVVTVERRLGVSLGEAHKLLDHAIKSGVIRSQRSQEDDGPSLDHGDFDRWLEWKLKPKSRSSPQVDLAREAITALWPDGRMPKSSREMMQPIADWVSKHHKGHNPPNRDSIRRAAVQILNAQHASPLVPDR